MKQSLKCSQIVLRFSVSRHHDICANLKDSTNFRWLFWKFQNRDKVWYGYCQQQSSDWTWFSLTFKYVYHKISFLNISLPQTKTRSPSILKMWSCPVYSIQEWSNRKEISASRDRKLSINDSYDCPSRDDLPKAPVSAWAWRLQKTMLRQSPTSRDVSCICL